MESCRIFPIVPKPGLRVDIHSPFVVNLTDCGTAEVQPKYVTSGITHFIDRVARNDRNGDVREIQKAASTERTSWLEIRSLEYRLNESCVNRRLSKLCRSSECLAEGLRGKKMIGMEKKYAKLLDESSLL